MLARRFLSFFLFWGVLHSERSFCLNPTLWFTGLKQKYTALDADKERLEAQLEQETTDGRLATALVQLGDAKQEARVAQSKIQELEKLCGRLQQQVHRMGGEGLVEVSELRKQNASLQQKAKEAAAQVARAQAKQQSMRASHAFLTTQLAKAQLAAAGMAYVTASSHTQSLSPPPHPSPPPPSPPARSLFQCAVSFPALVFIIYVGIILMLLSLHVSWFFFLF